MMSEYDALWITFLEMCYTKDRKSCYVLYTIAAERRQYSSFLYVGCSKKLVTLLFQFTCWICNPTERKKWNEN